jgi:hydrogenase expression/formation protein HypD
MRIIMKNEIMINYLNNTYKDINLMEVCGTHTMAISKYGIRSLLNKNINLISGPGCPVCVTPDNSLDYIYDLSLNRDIIIATYGDMIRVPGSDPSFTLEKAKAKGAGVAVVYSSMDALKIAKDNKDKKVVFLGIGFETTMPSTAVALLEAEKSKIENFYVYSLHKKVEPAIRALIEDKEINIDGFILPGHVACILGQQGFNYLKEYKINGAITGFEYNQVLEGIYTLVKNINDNQFKVENCYESAVDYQSNSIALSLFNEVFCIKDDNWRGIGIIENSGYKLNKKYNKYDIENIYPNSVNIRKKKYNCRCGDVIKGIIKPKDCGLFGKVCNPDNPVGPCMVSSEGSCAAYYRYNDEI